MASVVNPTSRHTNRVIVAPPSNESPVNRMKHRIHLSQGAEGGGDVSLSWVFSCDMFTRIAVLSFNSTDRTLDYAYGAHPPALVRRSTNRCSPILLNDTPGPLTLEQDNCTRFIAELLSPLKT